MTMTMTMTTSDVARVLSVLVRSDDEALAYFAVRARVSDNVSLASLKSWRAILSELVGLMSSGDRETLDAYEAALRGATKRAEQAAPTAASEAAAGRWDVGLPLPVAPSAAPAAAPQRPMAQPFYVPADTTADEVVDSTQGIDVSMLGLDDVLPFSQGPASLPVSAVGDLPPAESGETAFVPCLTGDDLLPFRPTPDPYEALDLHRYACFCLERQLYPGHRDAVRARYGLVDERAEQQIDRHWAAALAADGNLRAELTRRQEAHRAWLATGGDDGKGTG